MTTLLLFIPSLAITTQVTPLPTLSLLWTPHTPPSGLDPLLADTPLPNPLPFLGLAKPSGLADVLPPPPCTFPASSIGLPHRTTLS